MFRTVHSIRSRYPTAIPTMWRKLLSFTKVSAAFISLVLLYLLVNNYRSGHLKAWIYSPAVDTCQSGVSKNNIADILTNIEDDEEIANSPLYTSEDACFNDCCVGIVTERSVRQSIDRYRKMCPSPIEMPNPFNRSFTGPTPTPLPFARKENLYCVPLNTRIDELSRILSDTGSSSEIGPSELVFPIGYNTSESLTETFLESFEHILAMIRCRTPFAVTRYGDGEMHYIRDRNFGLRAGRRLAKTLSNSMKGFFHGIPFPTCKQGMLDGFGGTNKAGGGNWEWTGQYFGEKRVNSEDPVLTQTPEFLTYSVIFSNRNHPRWINFMKFYLIGRDDIILFCNDGIKEKPPAWAKLIFTVPNKDIVAFWENEYENLEFNAEKIALAFTGHTFIFAAGQISEPLIDAMYKVNPLNQYIDLGSTVDIFLFGEVSRTYLNNHFEYVACTEECHEYRYKIDRTEPDPLKQFAAVSDGGDWREAG